MRFLQLCQVRMFAGITELGSREVRRKRAVAALPKIGYPCSRLTTWRKILSGGGGGGVVGGYFSLPGIFCQCG